MTFWAYKGTEKWFTVSVWYGNNNDAFPHAFRPNAIVVLDAMIRDVLNRFPIDRNRVFIQGYSQGGLTIKELTHRYRKDTPVVFAGILFTDANCWGGNANTAAISPDTAIFIGVGELDLQPYQPFNCVEEAEKGIKYSKINMDALLRGDTASRGQFYKDLFYIGALSPNDIRSSEDMNSRDGGNEYYTPVNMRTDEEITQKIEDNGKS